MGPHPSFMYIMSLDQNASHRLRVTVTRRNIQTNKFGFETVRTIGSNLSVKLLSDLKHTVNIKPK